MLNCTNTSDPGMHECKTVSMTLDGLMTEKADQIKKLKEIQYFDAQYHVNGLETSDDQTEILNKEIEDRKQDNACLRERVVDLKNGIKELESEKEALNKVLNEKDSRLVSLERAVKQNKINQEEELKKFKKTHTDNIQRFKDEFEREIFEADRDFNKKITEIGIVNKRLNQDIKTLKKENAVMENELKEGEEIRQDANYYQSYIGQVCLTLQIIMYRIVLPNQFVKDLPYKVKDIEEDIDDEELLNEEEREKALKRWKDLKKKLGWEPSLERTLKILQKEGNPCMIRPESLNVKEAERAAEELNKQGRLGGRTSYEKVKKIIEMWKTSTAGFNSAAAMNY